MRPGAAVLVVGVVVLALAYALPVQRFGCGQKAHYSLVRALADGTPRIDRWAKETCDISYFDGHYYSNKAPGLAFTTLPVYLALDVLGLVPMQRMGATRVGCSACSARCCPRCS